MRKSINIVLCLMLTAIESFSQVSDQQAILADSIAYQEEYIKSNQFYDGLQQRSRNSKFTKFIVNSIIVNNDWKGEGAREASKKLIDETAYFSLFENKEIVNIHILPRNIYGDSIHTFFTGTINMLHVKTREMVIRQNLLFTEGDKVNAHTMILNEEILRAQSYISDAYIIIQHFEQDTNKVNVYVHSRDHWSIDFNISRKHNDEYRMLISDDNFLGLGHKLKLGTYMRYQSPYVVGHTIGYSISNIKGSFFDLDLFSDKSYKDFLRQVQLKKDFIKPTDYMAGLLYEIGEMEEKQLFTDTSYMIKRQHTDAWSGISHKIGNSIHNIFFSARLNSLRHFNNPIMVTNTLNPYYRDATTLLFSLGLYHENFYRGSYIYSFAVSEDISYGYKLELIGGRSWDNYANRNYLAVKWKMGYLLSFGYLRWLLEYGSFFHRNFIPEQSVLSFNIGYFTHLYDLGKGYLRNFINFNYVGGFHRLEGERDRVTLNNNLRTLNLPYINKLHRSVLDMESVYFSPFYIYNFRFAFYGFCDLGLLSNDIKNLSNDFYTTMGLGIRIQNDRLIFTSIQLQFGYAVISPADGTNYWFIMSNDQRMPPTNYKPDKPAILNYQ